MEHSLYKPLLAASVTVSTFLVGCQFSLSYVSIAALLDPQYVPENVMLGQFRTIFSHGFRLCPSSAIISGLCCFANAAVTFSHTRQSTFTWQNKVYRLVLAGALMISLVPYTLACIVPIEEPLLRRESKLAEGRNKNVQTLEAVAGSDETEASRQNTIALLRRWKKANYFRTLLPALGLVVARSLG